MTQKYVEGVVTGYKATDKDMKCRGHQFVLGEWAVCSEGDIIKCGERGFHFCKYQSGPYAYYSTEDSRLFKVEAKFVLDLPADPGADYKLVCREIKLVEEVVAGGNRNTGNWNTGNWNTGDWNTGDCNTGDWNTGNWNTGDWNTGSGNTGGGNTGNWNTGDWNTGSGNTGSGNTGNRNTGDWNTGDWNTGNWNTGDWNTGSGNTGNWNTGDWNTGSGNCTNNSTGMFCTLEPTVLSFDVDSGLTRSEYVSKFPEYANLARQLASNDEIDFNKYSRIPGITPEKLKSLHEKHKQARAAIR